MLKLNENDLKELKGGFNILAAIGVVSCGVFICGILDGITRPLRCN